MKTKITLIPASGLDDLQCADGELLHGAWNGSFSDPDIDFPAPPEVRFSYQFRALPPYLLVSSALPEVAVKVSIGSDDPAGVLDWINSGRDSCSPATRTAVNREITEAYSAFIAAVEAQSLHYLPVYAAVSWRLPDGTLWQLSTPVFLSPSGSLPDSGATRPYGFPSVSHASVAGGYLYLTLQFPHAPFTVEGSQEDLLPRVVGGITLTPVILTARSPDGFPPVLPADQLPVNQPNGLPPGQPVPVTTRPLKLGDASVVKKLEEVEALWPDGSRLPLKVYGAMRLGRWRFLGLARNGRMRLRGSGWRFFKFETFAINSASGCLLPQIFIIFAP